MKRIADNQLTKDDHEDDGEDGAQIGMKRASEETIATRKVKGLPKRLGGTTPSNPPSTSTEAPPKLAFGGFGGFGASATATTSESSVKPAFSGFGNFGSSAASTTDTTPKFSGFGGFGASNPAPTTVPVAPVASTESSSKFSGFGTLGFSTSPSKTSQLFGESISSASTTFTPQATTSTPQANPFASIASAANSSSKPAEIKPAKTDDQRSEDANLDYCLSLRGLNHSVLTTIENAIAADPFVSLPFDTIGQQYAKHRKVIQDTFDGVSKASQTPAPTSSTKPAASSTLFSMPTPPAGGFSFGGAKLTPAPATTTSTSSALGFVPKATSDANTKSPFSFGSLATSSAPVTSLPFSFSNSSSASTLNDLAGNDKPKEENKSAFGNTVFGNAFSGKTLSGTSGETIASKPPTFSGFSGFGSLKPKESDASSDEKKVDANEKQNPTALAPSSGNPFSGLSAAKPPTQSFFSFGNKPQTTTAPAAPTTPSSDAKRPSIAAFGFGSSPGSSFNFGGGAPSGLAPATTGSLGNPVGFSFGSPPKESAIASAASSSTAAATESASGSTAPTAATGDSKDGDVIGEGEEEEETDVSERGKVYKLNKAENSWTDMGIGYFKLKTHKETGKKRVLCRMENTGRVLVNFNLYKGLNVKAGAKPTIIVFSGYDGQEQVGYQVRFKTEANATAVRTKVMDAVTAL